MKKNLINILIFIVLVVLGGVVTYFWILNGALKNQLANVQKQTEENFKKAENQQTQAAKTSSPTSTAQTANLAGSENKPSEPAETYTVGKGETLYPIGLKLNLDWTYIAEANNLVEPYTIKAGQILVIPHVDGKQKVNQIEFRIDDTRAQKIQSQANAGTNPIHLDPLETAKNDTFNLYGISSANEFSLGSRDNANSEAIVNVLKKIDNKEKKFEIRLTQPSAAKGPQGIWAIEYIKPL